MSPLSTKAASKPRLLSALLDEQGQLTAVDRFAGARDGDSPTQARYYRDLLPLEQPRPGEQYAFSVDLDACSGCKACVSACHSLNGLDDHELWRNTGLLHGGTCAEPYQQVVTTACHHCVDPACLNGCPVLAYEKDPLTGIVRHLDDQCIGCQYCILKCPYDVPKYSQRRGIVRKCDMCHSRLAADEAPACVQACPSAAIQITLVSKAAIAERCAADGAQLLPGTVSSSYTQPTTSYLTQRTVPDNVEPADASVLRREPAHWPLIWMLLLTQTAAGLSVGTFILALCRPLAFLQVQLVLSGSTGTVLLSGLAASLFHLGRPSGAWRAFLGWRRSWMSREIVALAGFAFSTLGLVAAATLSASPSVLAALSAVTAALALLSVFCSAMIYVDTRRIFWRAGETFPRFFGTMLQLGAGAAALAIGAAGGRAGANLEPFARAAGWTMLCSMTAAFAWEGLRLAAALENPKNPNHQPSRVLWQHCRGHLLTRGVLFLAGTAALTAALTSTLSRPAAYALALLCAFASQVLERYCYFVGVVPPRMPGGPSS